MVENRLWSMAFRRRRWRRRRDTSRYYERLPQHVRPAAEGGTGIPKGAIQEGLSHLLQPVPAHRLYVHSHRHRHSLLPRRCRLNTGNLWICRKRFQICAAASVSWSHASNIPIHKRKCRGPVHASYCKSFRALHYDRFWAKDADQAGCVLLVHHLERNRNLQVSVLLDTASQSRNLNSDMVPIFTLDPTLPSWRALRRNNYFKEYSIFRRDQAVVSCNAEQIELRFSHAYLHVFIYCIRYPPRHFLRNESHANNKSEKTRQT